MPKLLPKFAWVITCLTLFIFSTSCSYGQEEDVDLSDQIERVENGLLTYHVVAGEDAHSIKDRLKHYSVPGVSVAVIKDGELLWARGWGETKEGSGIAVDSLTLFQAASISKPVASVGALRLVEQGVLSFDDDVNEYLRSWKVPENMFTEHEKVTLRRLLSHSAGTNVHGFPGYSSDESVPTVTELLNGEYPSNTEAVRVLSTPGSEWRYSGGGTTIAQLMMTDVSGMTFEEIMQNEVLEPIGMANSTFSQPLSEEFVAAAATAHLPDGTPIEGNYHTYPEQAAAGLWTTPSDLALLAIDIQRSFKGDEGGLLSQKTARTMLSTEAGNWGLGFSLNQANGHDFWFSHGGSNMGFKAYFTMLAESGTGAVIMTNGEQGTELGREIMRGIANVYDLPGYEPVIRNAIDLTESELASISGSYYLPEDVDSRDLVLKLYSEDGELLADIPSVGWQGKALRGESENTLFFTDNPGELNLRRDEAGEVTYVELSNLGTPVILERRF